MEKQRIDPLNNAGLEPEALQKIKLQANYIGLQNNYVSGDKVSIMIADKMYEVEFDKEEALLENMPLSCSPTSAFLQQFPVKNSREGREKLAGLLGLSAPVDEKVFFAVVHDPTYFHHLVTSKDTPAFLGKLLNNPPSWEGMDDNPVINEKTTGQLISKVAKSMIDWGKTGFSKVDDLTFERRFTACMSCKFLKDPPDTLAYKFATLGRKEQLERKICGMCGCVVSGKAKLPHESCPVNHDEIKGMTRWNEPAR